MTRRNPWNDKGEEYFGRGNCEKALVWDQGEGLGHKMVNEFGLLEEQRHGQYCFSVVSEITKESRFLFCFVLS